MAAAGIPVSIATDNVRDGFFAFGDHDPLATLAVAAFAAHLPAPLAAWGEAITRAPARAMGLAWDGTLAEGAPADLVLFDGRSDSEVLARFGHPRRVLRAGRFVAARPPSHRELDT
jgi:cytosine deaminase